MGASRKKRAASTGAAKAVPTGVKVQKLTKVVAEPAITPVEELWPPPPDAGVQWLQQLSHWAAASERSYTQSDLTATDRPNS